VVKKKDWNGYKSRKILMTKEEEGADRILSVTVENGSL